MRVALFGATGGLGRHVLRLALDRGHEVSAHVRSPEALGVREGLTTVRGDLTDAASIREAIAGCDAVLSCVGHAKGQDPAVYGEGMRHIVDAMGASGIRRLVSISGAGLELDGDASGLGRRIVILLLRVVAGRVLAGKQREWDVISGADLDWTLVRVARMVERPGAGSVSVDLRRVSGSAIVPYPDVAAWMLDRAADASFLRQAPFVSGP